MVQGHSQTVTGVSLGSYWSKLANIVSRGVTFCHMVTHSDTQSHKVLHGVTECHMAIFRLKDSHIMSHGVT